jgi:hypothetical protein
VEGARGTLTESSRAELSLYSSAFALRGTKSHAGLPYWPRRFTAPTQIKADAPQEASKMSFSRGGVRRSQASPTVFSRRMKA